MYINFKLNNFEIWKNYFVQAQDYTFFRQMKLVRSQLQKSQLKSDGRIATEEFKKAVYFRR